ncbi:MAG: hypothetical protein JW895_17825 [Thermoleophilaceae bacterium]|nr:hypothetical protein [Thermoleophilaceae bacterium]
MDFGTVLIVVSIVAGLVAIASFWGSGRIYRGLGRTGGLTMDSDAAPAARAPASASSAEAREEIRQMLEAKSARRESRGEAPIDVEAELDSLTRSAPADEALRDEVRQLVIARNARRARRGEAPLDVEAEIDRQLRDLGA